MNAFYTASRPHKTSTRSILSVLMLALTLAACSNPMEVTPDDEPIIEEPAPKQNYSVEINFVEIDIKNDCDADTKILGVPVVNEGELAYQAAVSYQRPDGSWTSPESITQTQGFGSKGNYKKYRSGETISLNRKKTLILEEGLNYRIHLKAIEWDGDDKDGRLNGKAWETEENNTGAPRLNHLHYMNVGPGANECRLELKVEAVETPL